MNKTDDMLPIDGQRIVFVSAPCCGTPYSSKGLFVMNYEGKHGPVFIEDGGEVWSAMDVPHWREQIDPRLNISEIS